MKEAEQELKLDANAESLVSAIVDAIKHREHYRAEDTDPGKGLPSVKPLTRDEMLLLNAMFRHSAGYYGPRIPLIADAVRKSLMRDWSSLRRDFEYGRVVPEVTMYLNSVLAAQSKAAGRR